jgi:hypothetical protein
MSSFKSIRMLDNFYQTSAFLGDGMHLDART